jgi:hypothetical protein
MTSTPEPARSIPWISVGAIAGAKLLLHLLANLGGGYGYFRDELYYLASTRHLDWGYVDHPPLSVGLLAVQRWLFGDSVFALRLLPALFGAATVAVVMLLARRLGGGRWAMALAGTAVLVSPIALAFGTTYSMNAFDLLVWATAGLLLARLVERSTAGDWLALGLVLGLGLLNKTGVLWLGAGIFVAVLLTPLRAALRTRWPWLAAALALLLFSPYVIWNAAHDLAHLEFIGNAVAGKYSGLDVATFLTAQLLIHNPVAVPLWAGGLGFLLAGGGRRFRALGLVVVGVAAILVANGSSKPEYLSGAMLLAVAGGGVAWERWLEGRRQWARPVLLGVLLVGLVLAPLTLPILPVDTYVRYQAALGVEPHTAENKELSELPQFYADMFGWREKADAVAAAYAALSPEERERVAIFAGNYGRAGAVDLFGPELGLPAAISSHNSYWLWGPGDTDGSLVLVLGGRREELEETFREVTDVGRVTCSYCMPYESDLGLFLARDPRQPLGDIWSRIKNFS